VIDTVRACWVIAGRRVREDRRSHARIDVVAAANEARAARADLILTVGGGSVTGRGQEVGLCLGNDVHGAGATRRVPCLDHAGGQERTAADQTAGVRFIAVPQLCRRASSPRSPAAPTPRGT